MFNAIIKKISNFNFDFKEKTKLTNLFVYKGNINIEKLAKLDVDLLELYDNILNNLFEDIKNKFIFYEKEKYKINWNYIVYKIKNELNDINLNNEDKEKIKYLIDFNEILLKIRKIYFWAIVLNGKTKQIYNLNNKYIIFVGDKYLLSFYSIKNREFIPLPNSNSIEKNISKYINFEISDISQNLIILNNNETKIIKFIDTNNFCISKIDFNYFSTVLADNNYLLIDYIKEKELQFSLINLSTLSIEKDKHLIGLLNFKIDNNLPKIILNKDFSKLIYLYGDNQICIEDYMCENNNKNRNNPKQNIAEIKFKKNKINFKVISFSEACKGYEPSNLIEKKSYYCSINNSEHYFVIESINECFFKGVKIGLYSNNKSTPKNIKITIYDSEQSTLRNYKLLNKRGNSSVKVILNSKGKFIKFYLLDNYGGEWIMIKSLTFDIDLIDSKE